MLPGSQPRFRKRHPAVKGCRLFATRQSENRAIQDLTVGCQSPTRRSPSAARGPRPRVDVTRRSSLGRARGRGAAPAAPRPRVPEATPPKLRACSPPPTLRLERGASVGGEMRTLALKNLGDVRADAQWIVTARLLYHLHDPVAQPSRMQGIYPRAR